MKEKVLFVCIHNSARSQMAEAYLNQLGGDKFEAFSAGIEPGTLNPLAVKAMMLAGIDISKNQTTDVFELYKNASDFDYVITVCDEASSERCPVFPGKSKRMHWGFEDPSAFTGSEQEKLEKTLQIRDKIKVKVEDWISNFSN